MICAVGVNHRAPLVVREVLAMSSERVAASLRQLQKDYGVQEAAILSTCNRTEVYGVAAQQAQGLHNIRRWFAQSFYQAAQSQQPSVSDVDVQPHLYQLESEQAVGHLFRVACGLDSQLLGESEITGQVKQFAALAREVSASGPVINRLMERALRVAKEVRTQTEIGRHSLSYAGLAARSAMNIFTDMRELSVLLVGTGEMCVSAATVFSGRGVRRLVFAGRSLEKTEEAAKDFDAESLLIAAVPSSLAEFDVVVSATASQVPIIGKGAVERALAARHRKPMMFADLAVPRDLEAEIQQLPDVFVYHLDQFANMAQHGIIARQQAAKQAQLIIEQHVVSFCQWLRQRANAEPIRALRSSAQDIQNEELQAALAKINRGEATEEVLNHLARRLTNRLVHLPTEWLREQDNESRVAEDSE